MNTALALTLLQFVWEGAAIALALFVSFRIARSASARYVLACLAMLTMVTAFGATFLHYLPRAVPAPLPPSIVWTYPPASGGFPLTSPRSGVPPWWLTPVWMIGASLFSLRSVASWLATQRLRSVGVCVAPEPWQERVRKLAAQIRVSRPVELLESCLTQVPVVIGWVRPVILFPAGLLAGLPAEQVDYFLIHELAHIRRWDYLVNLLQTVVENLLFYHPAAWWISSVMRAERENCCDDAVAALGNAREFATALASLEQRRGAFAQPAVAATGGSLLQRVRRLLGQPEPRRGAIAPVLLAGIAAVAFAVAMGAPQEEKLPKLSILTPKPPRLLAQAKSKNPPPSTEPDESAWKTPYQKWLNEEVVYIITEEERKAFRNLQTDEEHQMFIEQFWLRRDPTPNTPENEMRAEHYRRIAYANQKFSSAAVPGWKTDRGMIYIKYGPPDERETHAEANPPSDLWQYRFITGIGTNVNMEFVDENRTGEYHMTRDPSVPADARPLSVARMVTPGGRGGPATPTSEAPISYFEAQVKALEYEAGYESASEAYRFQRDPETTPLADAVRQLDRAVRNGSPDAQAALERLRIAVEDARAARLGTAVRDRSLPQTPWWAPDPQNASAVSQAMEVTARIQTDGTAQQVIVVRSNDPTLNQSAIQAVQTWRFPILNGGREPYTLRVLVDPSKLARR